MLSSLLSLFLIFNTQSCTSGYSSPAGKKPISLRKEKPFHPSISRSRFLASAQIIIGQQFIFGINEARGFEGGVGGLGKVKPETGVVFRDSSLVPSGNVAGGAVSCELLSPNASPVLLSYKAPWPLLTSTSGIESRGLSDPESAFVQVTTVPKGIKTPGKLPASFFKDAIFSQAGKFGAYGAPYDIKIKQVVGEEKSSLENAIFALSFTALTPGLKESDRKAYISTYIVEDGVFMLITGTTAIRFRNQEKVLKKVADSFQCVSAPKSSLRNSQ